MKDKRIENAAAKRKAVVAYFRQLRSVEDMGRQKYSFEWILAKVATKFYLSETYVEKIIRESNNDTTDS